VIQYFIGVLVGLGAGIAIGLYIARGKNLSELTRRDRKHSIVNIAIGLLLLIVGISILVNMVAS